MFGNVELLNRVRFEELSAFDNMECERSLNNEERARKSLLNQRDGKFYLARGD